MNDCGCVVAGVAAVSGRGELGGKRATTLPDRLYVSTSFPVQCTACILFFLSAVHWDDGERITIVSAVLAVLHLIVIRISQASIDDIPRYGCDVQGAIRLRLYGGW